MTHVLSFAAYCGMTYAISDAPLDLDDVRRLAARAIRRARRRGQRVDVLSKGERYELCEPEGSAMVPDTAGVLTIKEGPRYACRECGTQHVSRYDAAACCAEED